MNIAVEPMDKFFNYRISKQLYAGSRTLVYRAIQEADQLMITIHTLLHQEYPTFNLSSHLENLTSISLS